jgi:hypothetical protein
METKKLVAKPKKRTGTRILKPVLAIVVILIVAVVFVLPALVSSESVRKTILAKINNSIAGKADFSGLSMSWRKGVKVTDLSFEDNAGQIMVKVNQIATMPYYTSILFGDLAFGQTVIDQPRIEINLKDLPSRKVEHPQKTLLEGKRSQPTVLPITRMDLVVNDGSVKITSPKAETVELSKISSRLDINPLGQQTNFDMNMTVVDEGKESDIIATGQVIPGAKTGWSSEGISGNLTVEVDDLDVGSLEPILALAGIEVQAQGSIRCQVKSEFADGQIKNLKGQIKGKALNITSPELEGDRFKSDILEVDIELASKPGLINVDSLQIHSDWADAKVSGVVPTTFKSLEEFLQADSVYNLDGTLEFDPVLALSQMPHTFGVKEGVEITSGHLSSNIETRVQDGRKIIVGQGALTGLQGKIEDKTVALSEPIMADVEITSGKSGINFDKLAVSAAFAKISCTGTSELLKYDVGIDMAELQDQLGQFINIGEYKVAGAFLSKGSISIGEKEIGVVSTSVVKDFRLSSAEKVSAFEPKADIALSATIDRSKNVLNINTTSVEASFGQINIKGASIPLDKKATEPMELNVSANVDLAKLGPFAVLLGSLPADMRLEGTVVSNLSVNAKDDSYHITTTDAMEIKGLKIISPGKNPFEQSEVSVTFDAELNPARKALAFNLISPEIKIKGDLQQIVDEKKTKLEGLADCEYDWVKISGLASQFLPEGLKLEGNRKDTIKVSSEYQTGQTDKLLANLNTSSKLGFSKADYMGLSFGPTEIDIQARDGILEVAPFTTTVNNGQLNFAGGVDLEGEPPMFKISKPIQIVKDVEINKDTTEKLLKYVNPIFANAVNASGVANFDCERLAIPLGDTTGNELEVIGTISINQMRLQASDLLGQILTVAGARRQDQNMTLHPTRFVLQNGFLRYDDMQLDVDDKPVNFKGIIGVVDKSLDMTATVTYSRNDKIRKVALPLRGTIDKPKLDLGKLLEGQIEEQLKEQFKDKLKDKTGDKIIDGLIEELFK